MRRACSAQSVLPLQSRPIESARGSLVSHGLGSHHGSPAAERRIESTSASTASTSICEPQRSGQDWSAATELQNGIQTS